MRVLVHALANENREPRMTLARRITRTGLLFLSVLMVVILLFRIY